MKSKGEASRAENPSHANEGERKGASELNHDPDANERDKSGEGSECGFGRKNLKQRRG